MKWKETPTTTYTLSQFIKKEKSNSNLDPKTICDVPIQFDKKKIFIGNYSMKFTSILDLRHLQDDIEELLDRLDQQHHQQQHQQQQQQAYNNFDYDEHNHYNDDDGGCYELNFDNKEKTFCCIFASSSSEQFDHRQSSNTTPLIKFMKQLLKAVDKVEAKRSRGNKDVDVDADADDNDKRMEYDVDYPSSKNKRGPSRSRLTSFGRVSDAISNSTRSTRIGTTTRTRTRTTATRRSLSPFKQRKPHQTYSSKNTRLNLMKKRAQERDVFHMNHEEEEEEEDNHEHNVESLGVRKQKEEEGGASSSGSVDGNDNEEPKLLEHEDDDTNQIAENACSMDGDVDVVDDDDDEEEEDFNQNDGDDSIMEENDHDLENESTRRSTKRKHDESNQRTNKKMRSRVQGLRRLMKKGNQTNDLHNTNLIDSDEDDNEINNNNNSRQGRHTYDDLNDSDDDDKNINEEGDDHNSVETNYIKEADNDTTMTTATRSITSIAAVSPTQLTRDVFLDNHDHSKTKIDDTVTDDDGGGDDDNEKVKAEDKDDKSNVDDDNQTQTQTSNEQSGTITKFFARARLEKKKNRREHRGKQIYSSSADRALGLSPESIPKTTKLRPTSPSSPTTMKTPTLLNKSPTSTSNSKFRIQNPYKNLVTSPMKSKPKITSSLHIGLRNLGNTCYINASLQMLFSLPNFISNLQQAYDQISDKYQQSKMDSNANADADTDDIISKPTPMPITRAFLKVAWDAKVIKTPTDGIHNPQNIRSVNPSELKEAIDLITDKFAGYEQRDSHEFLSALIDYIHEELVKMTSISGDENDVVLPTDEYFKLNVKVCLTCDSCNYRRYVC